MNDSRERKEVWRLARQRRSEEPAGPHINRMLLQSYVQGRVSDESAVVDIRRHLARCEDCLREELRLEAQTEKIWEPIVLPLKALRKLGSMWIAQPSGLAASVPAVEEKRTEQIESGGVMLDARVALRDVLVVSVSQAGEPCAGWTVRLERLGTGGTIVEVSAVTGPDGRAHLGAATQEAVAGESFQVVADPPEIA